MSTEIPPLESDYRPLRIIGDQLRIGAVAYDIRGRRGNMGAAGVLRAEVRHGASNGPWVQLTAIMHKEADGWAGTLDVGGVPYLVRRWTRGVNGVVAEAGPVSDDEFEDFSERLGSKVRSG